MNTHLFSQRCVVYVFSTLLLAIAFLSATVSFQSRPFAYASYSSMSVALPPMNLTLVAANGTQLVINSTRIGSLPSYEARGGYKNQLGEFKGLANYTGVSFTTLCDLVGGADNNNLLRVSASDGYNITFTYNEINGAFITYDPATGDQVEHLQPLTPVIAYYKNDANLSVSEGPLRAAIIGPEGFATNSTYWVKYVMKLEIISNSVPELPSHMLVFLVMTCMVLALVASKKMPNARRTKETKCANSDLCTHDEVER